MVRTYLYICWRQDESRLPRYGFLGKMPGMAERDNNESDGVSSSRKTRRERFLEVAARRTRTILDDLRKLGNCGNRSAYEYSDADVEKIFGAIEQELTAARLRFRTEEAKRIDFSLD